MASKAGSQFVSRVAAIAGDRAVNGNTDDGYLLDCTATGASDLNVSLPAAGDVPNGFVVRVRRNASSTKNVIIGAPVSETLTLGGDTLELISDGSNWIALKTALSLSALTAVTGDLIYGSAAGVWSKLADVAVGSVLVSGGVGVAPAWSTTPQVLRFGIGAPADATAALLLAGDTYINPLQSVRFTTDGTSGSGNFFIDTHTQLGDDGVTVDHKMLLAYNVKNGVKVDANESSLTLAMESNWRQTGVNYTEFNLDYSAPVTGTYQRLWGLAVNRSTGAVQQLFRGGYQEFRADDNNIMYACYGTTGGLDYVSYKGAYATNPSNFSAMAPGIRLWNTNSSNYNAGCIANLDSSGTATSQIYFQNTSHASHYGDIVFSTRGARGAKDALRINSQACLFLGGLSWSMSGGVGTNTFVVDSGTAPNGNLTDAFQLYSADFAADNACPYFRTENGTVCGINQSMLTTADVTHNNLILSALTASTLIYSNASKQITSLANSEGFLYNDGSGNLSYAQPTFPIVTGGNFMTVDPYGVVTDTGYTHTSFALAGQSSHIADPSGGGTQDAEARSAINSILAALEAANVVPTS